MVSKASANGARHLHVFGVSLLLIVITLVVFLFGVTMEAVVSGTGLVTSRGIVELRAPEAGVWRPSNETLVGNRVSAGTMLGQLHNGSKITGIVAPDTQPQWSILETPAANGQPMVAGSVLVSMAPMEDAARDRIAELRVRVEIDEKSFGDIRIGQDVRLRSNMHSYRAWDPASGKVDRLEPLGEAGPNGTRRFHVWVRVENSPFPMFIGGSMKAEVIVGQKKMYQIILEH